MRTAGRISARARSACRLRRKGNQPSSSGGDQGTETTREARRHRRKGRARRKPRVRVDVRSFHGGLLHAPIKAGLIPLPPSGTEPRGWPLYARVERSERGGGPAARLRRTRNSHCRLGADSVLVTACACSCAVARSSSACCEALSLTAVAAVWRPPWRPACRARAPPGRPRRRAPSRRPPWIRGAGPRRGKAATPSRPGTPRRRRRWRAQEGSSAPRPTA